MLVPVPLVLGAHDWRRRDKKFLKRQALSLCFPRSLRINYAQSRATFRSGEIRILDSTGKLERMIAFTEARQKTVNAHLSDSGYVVAVCNHLE